MKLNIANSWVKFPVVTMLLFKSCTFWCFYSVWSFSIDAKIASVFVVLFCFDLFCLFFEASLTFCASPCRAGETRKGTSRSIAIVTSQNLCSVLDAGCYNSRIRYLIWLKCLCTTFLPPHVMIWLWINITFIRFLERPSRCVWSNLYNILCAVNTQHTSRQVAIITIRLYLATYFGRDRPSSGQLTS